jgi:hypothetical protein
MEQDQYTGKTGATPRRGDDSPRAGLGGLDTSTERTGMSRTTVWAVIAVVLVVGLFLYFRFERDIIALFDRGH